MEVLNENWPVVTYIVAVACGFLFIWAMGNGLFEGKKENKKIGCSTFTITVHYHDDKRVYSTGVKDKLFSGGLERKYEIWVPEDKYVDYLSLSSAGKEISRYNLGFDSKYGVDVLISLDFIWC